MTCTTCKYQWCWLCEGPYNYGHYDSGKCAGHQFSEADNLDEIQNYDDFYQPDYLNLDMERPLEYFGLHKIFPCVFNQIQIYIRPNIMKEKFCRRYILMLSFWFFGVFLIFVINTYGFFDYEFKSCVGCIENFMDIIITLIGICVFVSYQIVFSFIVTPFMIISLFYNKLFDNMQMFFELS